MGIGETVKKHPYLTAVGVFVVGVILVVILFSGDSDGAQAPTYVGTNNDSQVAANTQLSMAQLASQAQMTGMQIEAGVRNNETAAALELGKLQAQLGYNSNQLSADVAKSQIAAQADTQKLVSTLSAQVAQSQINASLQSTQIYGDLQESLAQINSANQQEMAKIQSTTMINMYSQLTAAEMERNRIAANERFANAALATAPGLYQQGGQWQSWQLIDAASKALNSNWNAAGSSLQPADVAAWQSLGYTYNPSTGQLVKAA